MGYHIGEVVACEARGAARVVHAHALTELAVEFPETVAKQAGAQLHHKLPQDIRLVSTQHLRELGPINLVVAGWPCQGSSTAGTGQGLDDARSGLFTELMRVLGELQALHQTWRHPLGYLIKHVSAGAYKRTRVRAHFEAVRGILGPELVMDAAQLGSPAHRLRAWWTNLERIALLRAALGAQARPANLFVHQVLGPGRRARQPQSTGVLPWAKVEVPDEPRRALNTFVNYGGSYAFSRGGGGVLACVQADGAATYEEPNAEERELAMGFPRGFTAARAVSEHTRRELLGQAMDLNSVMWILGAARAAGERRLPLGGEAVKVRSHAAGAAGAAEAQRGAAGAAGAQRGQPRAAGAAGAQRGHPRAAGAAGAAEAQRGAAGAQRGQPRAAGAAEAQRGAVGVRRGQSRPAGAAGAQRMQPQVVEACRRKEGAASGEPFGVGTDPRAVLACLGPPADAVGVGQASDTTAQPPRAVTVGGGPSGEGLSRDMASVSRSLGRSRMMVFVNSGTHTFL
jgi:hypothetical protein